LVCERSCRFRCSRRAKERWQVAQTCGRGLSVFGGGKLAGAFVLTVIVDAVDKAANCQHRSRKKKAHHTTRANSGDERRTTKCASSGGGEARELEGQCQRDTRQLSRARSGRRGLTRVVRAGRVRSSGGSSGRRRRRRRVGHGGSARQPRTSVVQNHGKQRVLSRPTMMVQGGVETGDCSSGAESFVLGRGLRGAGRGAELR